MVLIKDLIKFKKDVKVKGVKESVELYGKALELIKFESGIVSGYKVLIVYEVEDYLLGNNPTSSKEVIYSQNSVPTEIELFFKHSLEYSEI